MRTRAWRGVGAAALAMVALGLAIPAAWADRKDNWRNYRRDKKPRYIVVQVREADGEILFEVIPSDKLRDRQKQAYEDFKEAALKWVAAAKEAKKLKEKFDEPKPKKPIVKKVSKTFKERKDAEAELQKWQEKYEKYLEKKRGESKKEDGLDDFRGDQKEKGEKDKGDRKKGEKD